MEDFQVANLVYLTILLAVIIYFTLGGYKGNLSQAVKHAIIWVAIILALFVVVRILGF